MENIKGTELFNLEVGNESNDWTMHNSSIDLREVEKTGLDKMPAVSLSICKSETYYTEMPQNGWDAQGQTQRVLSCLC